jgi:hypothetical protein
MRETTATVGDGDEAAIAGSDSNHAGIDDPRV